MAVRAGAVAALALSLCGQAAAQRVTGVVVEQGRTVDAVLVTLMGADSTRLATFFSDSTGRFFFDVAVPGRYLLRSDRIGLTSTVLPIDVPAEGLAVTMEVPAFAVALAGIEVEGDGRCTVRPTAAAAAARIWEEARKSLELARFAAATQELTFRAARYTRELDAGGSTVLSERVRPTIAGGTRAFRPVDLAVLDTVGFVSAEKDSLSFFGPDADVLLSDQFLDHHCFEAVTGPPDAPERVGLRFRPVPGRRVPEIDGTIWLDAATAALLHLEFRYVQTRGIVPVGSATGRVDFARTDRGLVYVVRWWLRMPQVVEQNGLRRIAGWVEEGGAVQSIGGGRH